MTKVNQHPPMHHARWILCHPEAIFPSIPMPYVIIWLPIYEPSTFIYLPSMYKQCLFIEQQHGQKYALLNQSSHTI